MKSRDEIEVAAQVRFGEGGQMEVDEEVDTDLSDWGLVEDTEEKETKYEEQQASEFGVDDREVSRSSSSSQEKLVLQGARGQKDLTGADVGMKSNW